MTDMQRPGWIGRNKFEKNLRPFSLWLPSVLRSLPENRLQFSVKGCEAQVKIDEPRPGDFDLRDIGIVRECVDNARRDVARTLARRLCKPHGDVAGKVAMAGIASTLNRTFNCQTGRCFRQLRQAGKGILEELRDDVFH